MERIDFHGWQAFRLSNDLVELIAVISVGPRILHFGLAGCENELYLDPQDLGKSGGEEYRFYGGHRLWHAPEAIPRTYVPDNRPVQVEEAGGALRLIQPAEPGTGIQKEMEIRLVPGQPRAEILHRLRSTGLWPVELAAWAITQLAPGGAALLPFPPPRPHGPDNLLPDRSLNLWSYTELSDPRLSFHPRAVLLRQDPSVRSDIKLGAQNRLGWAAYFNRGRVFIKRASRHQDHLPYPDRGSSVELFANQTFLEIETLGPLVRLEPGQALEHRETWLLAQFDQPADPAGDLPGLLERIEAFLKQQE